MHRTILALILMTGPAYADHCAPLPQVLPLEQAIAAIEARNECNWSHPKRPFVKRELTLWSDLPSDDGMTYEEMQAEMVRLREEIDALKD